MITAKQLAEISPYSSKGNIKLYVEPLNEAMKLYSINTPLRASAFIAQILHESGGLNYVQEIASGAAYDNRRDLGNTEPLAVEVAKQNGTTAGRFYKGHGLIQITGFYNHRDCGYDLGIDLVRNPKLLTKPEWACKSAAWYWDTRRLNQYADQKEFDKITRAINGGYNGKFDRDKFYVKALKTL